MRVLAYDPYMNGSSDSELADLRTMRPDAILVSVGRGEVVDEDAQVHRNVPR